MCLKSCVSPDRESRGSHSWGSWRLEIKSKHVRILYPFFVHGFKTVSRLASGILYSFFVHGFKTVSRLASGSPVAWVQQAAPGGGAIAFCRLHCGFPHIMQKEGQTNNKERSAERVM